MVVLVSLFFRHCKINDLLNIGLAHKFCAFVIHPRQRKYMCQVSWASLRFILDNIDYFFFVIFFQGFFQLQKQVAHSLEDEAFCVSNSSCEGSLEGGCFSVKLYMKERYVDLFFHGLLCPTGHGCYWDFQVFLFSVSAIKFRRCRMIILGFPKLSALRS
jgi:hypothetical protein